MKLLLVIFLLNTQPMAGFAIITDGGNSIEECDALGDHYLIYKNYLDRFSYSCIEYD